MDEEEGLFLPELLVIIETDYGASILNWDFGIYLSFGILLFGIYTKYW